MTKYLCAHCGATLEFSSQPQPNRRCPHCGRKLHVCENCEFYDVSGCLRGGVERFTVAHGTSCDLFQFRLQPQINPH